ncbi:MAG TPA: DUF2520 domain-containing protein [Dehalococcoidia bacterium]|mgnify:FL=1|nr:DUF2520 domain-containing protein [Dehalococcoidia bacterium]
MTNTQNFDKATQIGFIGAGNVGGSLAVAMSNAGYPVTAVGSRAFASAQTFAGRISDCTAYENIQEVADRADFVFISTSDDAIKTVCDQVSWREGQGVAHCSGAASVDLLQPAVDQGAVAGAFHPLQAFNSVENGVKAIPGVTFGIEGNDAIQAYLRGIASDIKGIPISLRPQDKVLYHVSGVLMGNLLAVLASVAASMWEKFDHTRDEGVRALSPMMPAVSSNLDSVGVPQAVAGPYVRGDIGTVRKHLEAVSSSAPEYLALYIELALVGLPFAVEKGALAPERSQEIKELLESYRSTDSI